MLSNTSGKKTGVDSSDNLGSCERIISQWYSSARQSVMNIIIDAHYHHSENINPCALEKIHRDKIEMIDAQMMAFYSMTMSMEGYATCLEGGSADLNAFKEKNKQRNHELQELIIKVKFSLLDLGVWHKA